MANHVSSLKRARQTETRTAVNRANRSRVRTSLRDLREALVKGDVKAAQSSTKRPSRLSTRACKRAFCTTTPSPATRAGSTRV